MVIGSNRIGEVVLFVIRVSRLVECGDVFYVLLNRRRENRLLKRLNCKGASSSCEGKFVKIASVVYSCMVSFQSWIVLFAFFTAFWDLERRYPVRPRRQRMTVAARRRAAPNRRRRLQVCT